MSIRSSAHMALLNYNQLDEDGIMVSVSRQAIHEISEEIEDLYRKAYTVGSTHKRNCDCLQCVPF